MGRTTTMTAPELLALAERSGDRLIFAVIRARRSLLGESDHAMHVAGLCALLARRAGWPGDRSLALVEAALQRRPAEAGEPQQMLEFVEIFLARQAPAQGRPPVTPQQAARDLYMASAGHPLAAMLIKELGIHPPGSGVRLASGEAAIVVRRGAHASMPLACAIADEDGHPLDPPQVRDTAQAGFAIVGALADDSALLRIQPERLFAAMPGSPRPASH
ncbi:hypothetical protein [Pelomonas sp. KK5]|uniref:hypothetical protein n=1 Tax=Pelomonas sp. KK5 TaxID=1855730 RepID=UPI00117C8487|nr:hypothetical protein [Pelomonas sp. KK5]